MKRGNLPFTMACAALLTLSLSGISAQITLADTDNAAPVIKGAEDRQIYCGEKTIWISDDDLAEVTVNDVPVTLSSNGALTIKPASEIQVITATDNAGNSTSIKIVVNDGHMDANGICTVCGLTNLDNIIMTSLNKDEILGKSISRDTIKGIQLFNTLSVADESAWDVSQNQKGGVKAWITTDDEGFDYLNLAADGNIIANEISAQLFAHYSNLEYIDGLEYLNTGNVTNMTSMFSSSPKLRTLDLTSFDTSNVIDMGYMFFECTGLTDLNIDTFDTSNVTRTSYQFYGCENLEELNVENFDTSNVTTMEWMFGKCNNLKKLNVSGFDTSQVTDMYCMFLGCSSLQKLDVDNFDTSKVSNMASMFSQCSSLQELNVDNFDISNVTDMSNMFLGCTNLKNANLDRFNNN